MSWLSAQWKKTAGPKTKLYEHTEQGKQDARIAEEGVYSPAMRKSMIGESTAQSSATAQKREMDIKGGLQSSGFEGSIAGQRLLSAPGTQAARTVSTEAARINRENELSKIDASQSLATGKDLSRQKRQSERDAVKQGLAKAAGAGVGFLLGGPAGMSIGAQLGSAATGGPVDVSGVARDIYTDRLSQAQMETEKTRQETQKTQQEYYGRKNEPEPTLTSDILDRVPMMDNLGIENMAREYGISAEELKARSIIREDEVGNYAPQNGQSTPLNLIGGQGHSDTIYGYGGN